MFMFPRLVEQVSMLSAYNAQHKLKLGLMGMSLNLGENWRLDTFEFDLKTARRSPRMFLVHPEGDKNVSTKFHGDPSNSY